MVFVVEEDEGFEVVEGFEDENNSLINFFFWVKGVD